MQEANKHTSVMQPWLVGVDLDLCHGVAPQKREQSPGFQVKATGHAPYPTTQLLPHICVIGLPKSEAFSKMNHNTAYRTLSLR